MFLKPGVILLENKILDLLKFIYCPDMVQNLSSVSVRELHLFWLTSIRRMRSSAKKRCDIGGPLALILMGYHLQQSLSWSMSQDNIFVQMMKR